MKRTTFSLAIVLLCLFATLPASARLRTLGTIDQVGLSDDDPNHIVVVLRECEWDAVKSTDGGTTWHTGKRDTLPAVLKPLPATGAVCYRWAGDCLIRSSDAGTSWCDVSPWRFLRRMIGEDVEREKERFLVQFGVWLPADRGPAWVPSFVVSALCLLAALCIFQARFGLPWVQRALVSSCLYVLIGGALFAIGAHYSRLMCYEQWLYRQSHWDNGIWFPRWPLGILLHLTCDPWLAPVAVLICFPLTPLFPVSAQGRSRTQRRVRLLLVAAACLFVLFIPLAMVFGKGWAYGVP